MELYLIRHGIAADRKSDTQDESRELTNEGREKTRKVAKRLYDLDLRFDLILTSPYVRSRQTAQILHECGLGQIEASSYLAPKGNIADWVDWLEQKQMLATDARLAMVGHQPNLGQWAEILVWGDTRGVGLTDISQSPPRLENLPVLVLKKAGIIGLKLPETGSPVGCSQLIWLTPPRFLL